MTQDARAKGDKTRSEPRTTPSGEERAAKNAGAPLVASAVEAVDERRPPAPPLSRHGISQQALRSLLAQPATQKRIREVVVRRLVRGAPDDLIDELVQRTSVAALETTSWTPRSMETARAWIAGVAVRTVALYFRRESTHLRWINPEVEVEEQANAPEDAPDGGWLVSEWLARAVANNARDEETFALLLYKARTERSHEEVAADHGITVAALKSRIHDLKRKYASRWERRRQIVLLSWIAGGAVLAAVALVVWWALQPERPVEPAQPVPPVLTPVQVPPRDTIDTRFAPAESASALVVPPPVAPPPVPTGSKRSEKPLSP